MLFMLSAIFFWCKTVFYNSFRQDVFDSVGKAQTR